MTDSEFIQCIENQMAGADIQIMPEREFVDTLYPWFEPRTAPKALKRLKRSRRKTIAQVLSAHFDKFITN